MDFYFAWILSHQGEGGSAFGECFYAASHVKDGDPESWYTAWLEIARRVESQATHALEKGRRVSAREAYLRAFTYYQSAAIFIRPRDQRLREAWQKAQWCFRQAAAHFSSTIEPIQFPFEGKSLPGYFLRGNDGDRKMPTLIFFRTDYEVPIKAVVDYAITRSEVNADHLGLFGISGGGYMVTRAVTFEKRIKTCIASAPIIDIYRLVTAEIPRFFTRPRLF